MEDLSGQELGRYRLEHRLGSGGMGAVYRAVHGALLQPRAIKVLSPRLAADPTFVERFQREATIAAGLRHPNVVLIYDVSRQDDLHYIVMDLVQGWSLRDLLRASGPMPLERTVTLLSQLAGALDYAHGRGVVHRDVKPGNVLVGANDQVTLVDFGIARAAEESRLTRAGTVVGTPEYMAPEVLRDGSSGREADLYALGVLAYELLTGCVPFSGAAADVAYAQVYSPPPPPRTLRSDLPEWGEQALLRQLSKDPAERFPTAAAFVAALASPDGPTHPDLPAVSVPSAPPATVLLTSPLPASPRLAEPRDDRSATVLVSGPRRPEHPIAAAPAPAAQRRVGPGVLVIGAVALALVGAALFFLFRGDAGEEAVASPTAQTRPAAAASTATSGSAPTAPPAGPAAKPTVPVAAVAPASPPPAAASPVPAAKPAPHPAAPAPGPAAVPAKPSPTRALDPRTVLDERFASNARGWPSEPQGTATFADGVYRLFGRDAGRHVAVGAPLTDRFRDVLVTATFRKLGGPPGGGFGIIVRDQSPTPLDGKNQGGRYYVLEVGDKSEYGIWRRDVDRWVDIIPWTATTAIKPEKATNEITVRAVGSRFTILVNGTQVASVDDATLTEGRVGVYLGGDQNEIAVERFVVQVLE